jgi:exonuclease III
VRWRLVAWNILHGGGPRRVPEIALALVEQRPDAVVLTEFRPGRGGQLRGVLADHGLVHQATAQVPSGSNGVLIAARQPVAVAPTPPGVEAGRWLEARVDVGDGVTLLGVHVPDDSQASAKTGFLAALVERARRAKRERLVIAGDFNTARRGVDGPHRFGGEILLGKLETLGFRDAWRVLHPGEKATSWRDPRAETGVRIDAVWVCAGLTTSLQDVCYSTLTAEAACSDHAWVRVDLELEEGQGKG